MTEISFKSHFKDGIEHLQKHDPLLGAYIAAAPLPELVPHTDYYRALVRAIIGQQLSVKAAARIAERFEALFDNTLPSPDAIVAKTADELRAVGLSRPKAIYIQDLAQHIINGELQFDRLDSMSNQEIIATLTPIKGIGEWTVHMFLLFCMGRLDVLPVGDLGIRTSIQQLYSLPTLPLAKDIEHIAQRYHWQPYASIASLYLWQRLTTTPA